MAAGNTKQKVVACVLALLGWSAPLHALRLDDAKSKSTEVEIVEERNKQGKLTARYSMTRLLNGEILRDGPFETFYPNGKTAAMGTYVRGELDGEYVERNASNRLLASGTFEHGLRTGEWKFFDGAGKSIALVAGNYSITSIRNRRGAIIAKGSTLNGRRIGRWNLFYPDSRPAAEIEFRADGTFGVPRITLWNGAVDPQLVDPKSELPAPTVETPLDFAIVPEIAPLEGTSEETLFAVRAALKSIREEAPDPPAAVAMASKHRTLSLCEGLNDLLGVLRSDDKNRFEIAAALLDLEVEPIAYRFDLPVPKTKDGAARAALDLAFLRWFALAHLMLLDELRSELEAALVMNYGVGAGSLSEPNPGRPRLSLGSSESLRLAARSGLFSHRGTRSSAIEHAVDWLVRHQSQDGRFGALDFSKQCKTNRCSGDGDPQYDVITTSLAVTAILGDPRNQSVLDPAMASALGRALMWLLASQNEDGRFVGVDDDRNMYDPYGMTKSTSLAIRALAESAVALDSAVLRDATLKSSNCLLRGRNPYKGWRFLSPPNGENDMECTGHAVAALFAAREVGFAIPNEALEGALNFVNEMTDSNSGRTGYQTRGSYSPREAGMQERWPVDKTEWMTAVALYNRLLLGENPEKSPALRNGADLLRKSLPRWDESAGTIDLQYWYYGSLAMCGMRGKDWDLWRDKLSEALIKHQGQNGDEAGSWDPRVDPYGHRGGRVFSTALVALTLQVEHGAIPGPAAKR